MKPLELLIAVLLGCTLISRIIPGLRKVKLFHYLPWIAVIAIPIHLLVEGYRWQMVPFFIYAILASITSVLLIHNATKRDTLFQQKTLRIITLVLACLLFIGSVIFPALLPVPNLPKPTGPYNVGTTSVHLVDQNREEAFSPEPDDMREIAVTAWYPADNTNGEPVSYWDEQSVTGFAYTQSADMGTFWYTHLNRVKTNSYDGIPVSDAQSSWPIIIYSPSFVGQNSENTMLFEELASQGYIVFSIAHAYESIVSVLPDGQTIHGDLNYIDSLYDSHSEDEIALYEAYDAADSHVEKVSITQQILGIDDVVTNMLRVRTEDVIFVLDELNRLNSDTGSFQAKLALDRIGAMGWSFGGGTVLDACITDQRIKAGINLDGWPYGAAFNSGESVTQPFMVISSGSNDEMDNIVVDLQNQSMTGPAYMLSIDGAEHSNFWDFPLFFNIYKYLGYWGPIRAERMMDIHRTYTIPFFDQYIKGETHNITESNAFPEVTLIVTKTQ